MNVLSENYLHTGNVGFSIDSQEQFQEIDSFTPEHAPSLATTESDFIASSCAGTAGRKTQNGIPHPFTVDSSTLPSVKDYTAQENADTHFEQPDFTPSNNLPLGFNDSKEPTKYRSFIPSIFISAALPLRDVKKTVFDRKYNNITLHLNSPNQVPYGKYGRLLLSVLTTHAVQAKNNLDKDGTVTITYGSLQELLDEMQLRKQRGMDIMEQLNRFKSATFIYEEENVIIAQKSLFPEYFSATDKGLVQAKKISTGNIMFIDSLQYIELDDSVSDKRSISFSLVLNNKFVELCKKHSVPIDYTVYKEISSAMGKDLYAWIVYRNNSIGKDGIFIPRANMVAQFSGTIQPDQERANFKYIVEQIQQIQTKYYPDLRFAVDRDWLGITFYKSPQIMSPKDTRYVLVTNT